ncbi:MAG: helix-turn-helix domain-containing protein [Opitutaceae bacterium]|nr:helix-turn-helix domain-containing protein [Opitutaceae bacterium]
MVSSHAVGGSYSSEELARLLGVTSETVRNFLKRGRLIAHPALSGKGSRFPKWQFEPQGKFLAVVPWLEPLIAAYGHNGWGLVDLLTVPRDTAKGLSYLALLQQGEKGVQTVLAAAKRSNPS